jgi:Protein of unknown function (DUF2752)
LLVLALAALLALILRAHVPFCPMAGLLGVPCPGCGLTRATLALLHGNVREALHLHPLVFVLAPAFAWAMASAALSYVRGAATLRDPNPWFSSRAASLLASALLLATLGVWGVRFFGYLGGPAPVVTLREWADASWRSGGPSSRRPR